MKLDREPEFIVFTGPMMASKTTSLLSALERFKYQKRVVAAFKPAIDVRYKNEHIVTHMGLSLPAITVNSGTDILNYLNTLDELPDVIAVDEAFMIGGVAEALYFLYMNGMTVMVSTLDMTAQCKVFKEVAKLLSYATQIYKLTAVCTACAADAKFTYKKAGNDDDIEIGGHELYEPRCWFHHPVMCKDLVKKDTK